MRNFLLALSLVSLTAHAETVRAPRTVSYVDIERYVGDWYEIASIPQWFSIGCVGTTARYGLNADGTVSVLNQCHLFTMHGPVIKITGVAKVVEASTNSKLVVDFSRGRRGDYWILQLADDYSTAVVGTPDRKSLWILSRTPTLEAEAIAQLVAAAKADGFPVKKLRTTKQ